MKNLRNRFNRFCYEHHNLGIPNLMLYIVLGCAVVYIFGMVTKSPLLYEILCFDRSAILRGEVWRLVTYPFVYSTGDILFTAIALLCYFSLGRAIENIWGTFRFNLFYLTGVVLMDIYCMIFGCTASATYLNLSMILSYATLFPQAEFFIFFIIPIKAWVLALFYLAATLAGLILYPFPYNLFSVIGLANYFLFFGKDILNVIPISWQANFRRLFNRKKSPNAAKVIPFAGSYQATNAKVKAPYNHRCTICGRTDVSDPQLEFRYCSRCKGYYCYCSEHISNHTHITE